jgi:hypothetical protein
VVGNRDVALVEFGWLVLVQGADRMPDGLALRGVAVGYLKRRLVNSGARQHVDRFGLVVMRDQEIGFGVSRF